MKIHLSLSFFFQNPTIRNLFFISFFSFNLSPSLCEDALDEFKACGVVYNCGNLVNISYPFWGNERLEICGRQEFKLNCQDNETTTIEIDSQEYNVLNINQSNQRMTIARSDLFKNYCPENPIQTATLDFHLFIYSSNSRTISIWYNCPSQGQLLESYRFLCDSDARNRERANYVFEEPMQPNLTTNIGDCKLKIEVTVTEKGLEESRKNKTALLEKGLKQGFDVEYRNLNSIACEECVGTGGKCGSNETYPFYCICENQSAYPYLCFTTPVPVKPRRKLIQLSVILASASTMVIIMLIIFIYYRRKRMLNNEEIEQIIRRYATQAPKRYSYSKVKKITRSFKNKLGQGGFSIVYKGKLSDGRDVAVKLLNESKGNGHDFINELVSIGKTSHVNVVTLLGFCYERNKRALIYEYMFKGSLDKYISHKGLYNSNTRLDWTTLHSIVLDIARGLEYLHRGCNT